MQQCLEGFFLRRFGEIVDRPILLVGCFLDRLHQHRFRFGGGAGL